MKNSMLISGGVLIGAALMIFITTRTTIAPRYSQAIYDCGIRVAKGVTGTISGAVIEGHEYGYCQD